MSIINRDASDLMAENAEYRAIRNAIGIDSAERRITQLEHAIERSHCGYTFLQYDIAEVFKNRAEQGGRREEIVQNIPYEIRHYFFEPTGLLRQHGGHSTDSVYFLVNDELEDPTLVILFKWWDFYGVEYYTVPQSDQQNERITNILRAKLREWLQELHTSLINNLFKADDALQVALDKAGILATEKEVDGLIRKRDDKIRAHLRKAKENLAIAVKSAQLYDDSEKTADLLAGLRAALKAEVEAFNVSMATLGGPIVEPVS